MHTGRDADQLTADDLLAYRAWAFHRSGERNCLSNIRPPRGTGYAAAATTLVMLMAEARRLGLSRVALKADPALPANLVL